MIPTEGSPSPILQIRPDAIICSIDQRTWGRSLGFGEVKLAEATPNLNALGQDLTRLGALTKRIARCSNPALCFQIHGTLRFFYHHRLKCTQLYATVGYHMEVYICKQFPESTVTAMLHILSIDFPSSVEELLEFVTRKKLDYLVRLYSIFWGNCALEDDNAAKVDEEGLDLSMIREMCQSSSDRTRMNTFRY